MNMGTCTMPLPAGVTGYGSGRNGISTKTQSLRKFINSSKIAEVNAVITKLVISRSLLCIWAAASSDIEALSFFSGHPTWSPSILGPLLCSGHLSHLCWLSSFEVLGTGGGVILGSCHPQNINPCLGCGLCYR